MTHVIDQIAERAVALLMDQTDALDRVYRDLGSAERPGADGLPAINLRVGADTTRDGEDGLIGGTRLADLSLFLDLAVTDQEQSVSSTLFALRAQVEQRMAQSFGLSFMFGCDLAAASEIAREDGGQSPFAHQELEYVVTFAHDSDDPNQLSE